MWNKVYTNAETSKRLWNIVQEGMPVILRDKTTRLPMQSFEFAPGTLPFLTRNVTNLPTCIRIFHKRLNIKDKKINGEDISKVVLPIGLT